MYRRKERCAATASSFTIAQSYYEVRRKDYDWKNAHVDDAVMNECEEHWKDWVCLKHGQGDYASNWNDARTEFYRKLKLEYEELQDLERKMKSIQSGAEAGSCRGCK
jgi:hypothetical protein